MIIMPVVLSDPFFWGPFWCLGVLATQRAKTKRGGQRGKSKHQCGTSRLRVLGRWYFRSCTICLLFGWPIVFGDAVILVLASLFPCGC